MIKYKFISQILLAITLIINSFCYAQVYQKDSKGDYVVQTDNDKKFKGYNLKVPKPVIQGFFQTVALHVTSNENECVRENSKSFELKLNIYHPKVKSGKNPDDEPLPVIVFGYGGGFLSPYSTSSSDTGIQKWLASKGYIVIAPTYRIGIDLYNPELAQRAVWRAVQDIRIVNRYAREARVEKVFTVDKKKPLTYVGWSSGGFIGLHNLYLDEGNRPDATKAGYSVNTLPWYFDPTTVSTYDLGTLNQDQIRPEFKGDPIPDITVSIAGAIGSLDYIKTAKDDKQRALCTIHHPKDGVVPYLTGNAYENFELFASPSYTYPIVEGSGAIDIFFNNNSSRKPAIYESYFMQKGGVGPKEINGDAGGVKGPLYYERWYHDPAEKGKNQAVMDTILNFIKGATQKFGNNVPTVKKQKLPNLSSSQKGNNIIYPNPTKGEFSIYLGNKTVYKVDVYSIMGELVYSKDVLDTDFSILIDLSSKSKGVYIIHLYTLNDIEKRKLIVD